MSSDPYSALNAIAGQGLSLGALAGTPTRRYPDPVPSPRTRLLRVIMEDGKAYGVIVDGDFNHNDTLPALPLEQAEATVKMVHDIAEQEIQEAERRKLEEYRKMEIYRREMEIYDQKRAQQKMLADDAIMGAMDKLMWPEEGEKQQAREQKKRKWYEAFNNKHIRSRK